MSNSSINKPTADGTAGADVYAGCQIDWRGADVTPENFVKVSLCIS